MVLALTPLKIGFVHAPSASALSFKTISIFSLIRDVRVQTRPASKPILIVPWFFAFNLGRISLPLWTSFSLLLLGESAALFLWISSNSKVQNRKSLDQKDSGMSARAALYSPRSRSGFVSIFTFEMRISIAGLYLAVFSSWYSPNIGRISLIAIQASSLLLESIVRSPSGDQRYRNYFHCRENDAAPLSLVPLHAHRENRFGHALIFPLDKFAFHHLKPITLSDLSID